MTTLDRIRRTGRLTTAAQLDLREYPRCMGREKETPFARVPLGGPYEPQSPYTVEGQIDQHGKLARGLARGPALRWVVGAIIVAMLAAMIYLPFAH